MNGGTPIFIDTDAASWNMDLVALEKAFELYHDVKLVVSAELAHSIKGTTQLKTNSGKAFRCFLRGLIAEY